MKINEEKIKEILERGVAEVINKEHLKAALKFGKKLRVKFGIDPTAPDLHLGHAVLLRKLKQFQEAGHKIIFIIGDYTARIGDPSGVSKTRPELSAAEVRANMKHYLSQAGKILDLKKTEVLRNSAWLDKLRSEKILELLSLVSVNQMLEREDFKQRVAEHKSVRIHEFFYPILQGYDSVMVRADVEIGGKDQLFNLLLGRELMAKFGFNRQDILTVELLEGTDGVRKMSKSYGNYIALNDAPKDIFGKVMSLPDNLLEKYFLLSTDVPTEETKKLLSRPFEAKKILAYEIVKLYHGENTAKKAREYFEKTFSKKEIPENLKICRARTGEEWVNFLVREKLATSRSEAKRLIEGGGLDFNGRKIARASEQISENGTVKIGKRTFIKISVRA